MSERELARTREALSFWAAVGVALARQAALALAWRWGQRVQVD